MWYAGALPRLALLHRMSQSSNPTPPPLINIWYFHPGIPSIKDSLKKSKFGGLLKKPSTVMSTSWMSKPVRISQPEVWLHYFGYPNEIKLNLPLLTRQG